MNSVPKIIYASRTHSQPEGSKWAAVFPIEFDSIFQILVANRFEKVGSDFKIFQTLLS